MDVVPEWISAVTAVAVVVGGLWAVIRFGRRCDVEVHATAVGTDARTVLDIRASLNPVGLWRVLPYWPVQCDGCSSRLKYPSEEVVGEDREMSWVASAHCPRESRAWDSGDRDVHVTLRKKGRSMLQRRSKWGCPNHRVPRIEIFEVSLAKSGADGQSTPKERPIGVIMNALRGGFAEPNEHLQVTHVLPVDGTDEATIGWRVVLKISIPMETWSLRHPSSDAWEWTDDDFVARPGLARDGVPEAVDRSAPSPR